MKRYFTFRVAALVVAVIFFAYCAKKETLTTNEQTQGNSTGVENSFDNSGEIHKSMVKTAALGLLELSKQANFRSRVNAAVALKFDGDDNVLLKKLDTDLVAAGQPSLATSFAASISTNGSTVHSNELTTNVRYKDINFYTDAVNIAKSINGYTAWDETAYLQIYIPFAGTVNLNQQPVIVIVDTDTDECTTTGYQLDGNGVWQAITVNEAFAQTHLVWCVSANERVDDAGLFDAFISEENTPHAHEGVSDRENENYICSIRDIEVVDQKECWFCGEADASIVGAAIHIDDCSLFSKRFEQKNFKNISHFELFKQLSPKSGKASLIKADHFVKDHERMGFVWYEKDFTSTKSRTFSACTSLTFNFKSKNTPWGVQAYSLVWFDPGNNANNIATFSYPAEVNQPAMNIIRFDWSKSLN